MILTDAQRGVAASWVTLRIFDLTLWTHAYCDKHVHIVELYSLRRLSLQYLQWSSDKSQPGPCAHYIFQPMRHELHICSSASSKSSQEIFPCNRPLFSAKCRKRRSKVEPWPGRWWFLLWDFGLIELQMCTKSSFHSFRRFTLSKSTPPWTISSSVDHEMGSGQQLGPLMLPARPTMDLYRLYLQTQRENEHHSHNITVWSAVIFILDPSILQSRFVFKPGNLEGIPTLCINVFLREGIHEVKPVEVGFPWVSNSRISKPKDHLASTCCNLAQFVTQEGLRFREAKDTHWPGKYARWTRKYANVCF